MIIIYFVENIVHGEARMKNIKYEKEACFLCNKSGVIEIHQRDKKVKSSVKDIAYCPLCEGRKYISLIKLEDIQ